MIEGTEVVSRRGVVAANPAARMHVEMAEPMEITESAGPAVIAELSAMGHTVRPLPRIAATMNGAEVLKGEGRLRAGSGLSAAGV